MTHGSEWSICRDDMKTKWLPIHDTAQNDLVHFRALRTLKFCSNVFARYKFKQSIEQTLSAFPLLKFEKFEEQKVNKSVQH